MPATTAKGEARRTALLDAVLRVLERDGSGAITHRSVAAEAGVAVAAATYYFAGIDDLLVSALTRAADSQVQIFAILQRGDLPGFAAALFEVTHAGRASLMAQYELLFLALRRASLRSAAELWHRAIDDAIAALLPDATQARVAALAVDGLILRMLWRGNPGTAPAIEAALREILPTRSPELPAT